MSEEQTIKVLEGNLDGSYVCGVRIVAAKYNRTIVDGLIEGAVKILREQGVKDKMIQIARVPGAFEIPLALMQPKGEICNKGSEHHMQIHAQIALGCVIRGETAHFDQVVAQCSRGVMKASLRLNMPIGFGVLAVDNIEQARARSGGTSNRGEEAALAALEMAKLLPSLPN